MIHTTSNSGNDQLVVLFFYAHIFPSQKLLQKGYAISKLGGLLGLGSYCSQISLLRQLGKRGGWTLTNPVAVGTGC